MAVVFEDGESVEAGGSGEGSSSSLLFSSISDSPSEGNFKGWSGAVGSMIDLADEELYESRGMVDSVSQVIRSVEVAGKELLEQFHPSSTGSQLSIVIFFWYPFFRSSMHSKVYSDFQGIRQVQSR